MDEEQTMGKDQETRPKKAKQTGPTLKKLLDAIKKFEKYQEPGDLAFIKLYSDGSGSVYTTQAGTIRHFGSIEGAIAFLTS